MRNLDISTTVPHDDDGVGLVETDVVQARLNVDHSR